MTAVLTRLIHKIAIQLQVLVVSCTICSSRSRRSVRRLLDTTSDVVLAGYFIVFVTVLFVEETAAR
jgi:choline-glycine betaine transporter